MMKLKNIQNDIKYQLKFVIFFLCTEDVKVAEIREVTELVKQAEIQEPTEDQEKDGRKFVLIFKLLI